MENINQLRRESIIAAYSGVDEYIEKGGKPAVIGEKRMFGGRMYIKTNNGWKFFGQGQGIKSKEYKGLHSSILNKEQLLQRIEQFEVNNRGKNSININNSKVFQNNSLCLSNEKITAMRKGNYTREDVLQNYRQDVFDIYKRDLTDKGLFEQVRQRVKLDKLIPYQTTVSKKHLIDKIENGDSNKLPPIVYQLPNDSLILEGGTHRSFLAALKGEKEIEVLLLKPKMSGEELQRQLWNRENFIWKQGTTDRPGSLIETLNTIK